MPAEGSRSRAAEACLRRRLRSIRTRVPVAGAVSRRRARAVSVRATDWRLGGGRACAVGWPGGYWMAAASSRLVNSDVLRM